MYPGRFDESKEVVDKKHDVDGLIYNEVMPSLRYITSLVIYYES